MTHTSTEQPEELLKLAHDNDDHLTREEMDVLRGAALEIRSLRSRVQYLEASQAHRVPLSDEQITDIWMQPISNGVTASEWRRSIARAIEAAHGITQEKQG